MNGGLTIDEVSQITNVSSATIRNWIKTKYLVRLSNGLISRDSLDYFIENILGNQKLISRANKIKKDSHNHEELSKKILSKLKVNSNNLYDLGDEYESGLSNSYKNIEGIYYTPRNIVTEMFYQFKEVDKTNLTFCDPCCGSGNFLLEAINIGFDPKNIYGFDTDQVAVEISKKVIEDRCGYKSPNIVCGDFLEYTKIFTKNQKYDYIFTNPPWGKKISKNNKENYRISFGLNRSLDTSALFFFASLSLLNDNGILGFLLPDSFFYASIFEETRIRALSLNILKIVDFNRPFSDLVTKANAIIIQNSKNNNCDIICQSKGVEYSRSKESFINLPKSIFNFNCNNSDMKIIERFFSLPHVTLKDNATWGMGIVTGNNSKFLTDHKREQYIPVYRGSDITKSGLKDTSLYMPKDLLLYQQAAKRELYEAKEKIIYKFISSNLCFYNDNRQRYILNSANFLILDTKFQLTHTQLADLLNSDIVNWVFKKIFNTHKILRGDLEVLPIHYEFFKDLEVFNEEGYLEYLGIVKDRDGNYRLLSN